MLDTAQSSVTMQQTLKRGRWRGISKSLQQGSALKTNRNSFLILCACIQKESVTKGKRGEKRLKGDEWKGTPEPQGRGGVPLPSWKWSRTPSFAGRSTEANSNSNSNLLTKRMGLESPFWPALSKRNTLPRHLGNEAQRQHRTQHNFKDDWGTVKNTLDFLSQANFPKKTPSFLDISIEEMRYNPLRWDNVNYPLPTPLVYPCQCADPGL